MFDLRLAAVLLSALPQQAPERAALTGAWVLNLDKSDDPHEKLRGLRPPGGGATVGGQGGGVQDGAAGGKGGVGRVGDQPRIRINGRQKPPGMSIPDIGDRARGDQGGPRRPDVDIVGGTRPKLRDVLVAPHQLTLTVTDSAVQFTADEKTATVRPHGPLTAPTDSSAAIVTAEWKKHRLIVSTVAADGTTATEEYEVKSRKGVAYLQVLVQAKLPNGRAVKLKRVYDRPR